MRNSKRVANHPAGPFVCSYCSASRKRAHESDWAYFTRCSHILSQFYKCVHMCEMDSEAVVGCEAAASAFYLHFASRLCFANTTDFKYEKVFNGKFSFVFTCFQCFFIVLIRSRQKAWVWYYRSLSSRIYVSRSTDLVDRFSERAAPSLSVTAREMRYFLFPFCAAAVLRWTEHSGR